MIQHALQAAVSWSMKSTIIWVAKTKVHYANRAVWETEPHRCDCINNQGFFQLNLQSSTGGASSIHRAVSTAAVHPHHIKAELSGEQNLTGVIA